MRDLTAREHAILVAAITHGDSDTPVTEADRDRWLKQAAKVSAGEPCGCGLCPSIGLIDATTGQERPDGGPRVVLEGSCDNALLLLFIDGDVLSYLELAPMDDEPIPAFPGPSQVTWLRPPGG